MPQIQIEMVTPAFLIEAPEATYPIGSQAALFAPFPVDRGLWVEDRLVSTFVKTPNGRWTSYPGNDVNYPTLSALALAAPVREVMTPGIGQPLVYQPPAQAEPELPDAIYPSDLPPAYIPPDPEPIYAGAAQVYATTLAAGFRVSWPLVIGAAALLWLFAGKRRR